MPKPRKVLNAFTPREVHRITGLSLHMIDYLAREAYLKPTYDQGRVRGRVRYYSYRDLIVARIVQKLRESGVELKRLKQAIQVLSEETTWFTSKGHALDFLRTDGVEIYYHHEDGNWVELNRDRQQVFSFVINVSKTQEEVRGLISSDKRGRFTLKNEALDFAPPQAGRKRK